MLIRLICFSVWVEDGLRGGGVILLLEAKASLHLSGWSAWWGIIVYIHMFQVSFDFGGILYRPKRSEITAAVAFEHVEFKDSCEHQAP